MAKTAKKRKVLDDSGLSERERRSLRHQQRTLASVINQSSTLDDIETYRHTNNLLFSDVAFTREAVLDAENVKGIVEKYSKHAESLVTVARYDAVKLINKVRSQCSNRSAGGSRFFEWAVLGREVGICFNAVPERVRFWSFPEAEDKPLRKARAQRQAPDTSAEVKLKQVENVDKDDADKLCAIEKNMKTLKNTLRKRMKEEHGQPVEAIQYLLNPRSFTQSVENIFNFSFLIKRGQAAIYVQKDTVENSPPGVYVSVAQADETVIEPTQAIVSFTMKDWKELCEAYELTKGDLPHRTGSKQTHPTHSQAENED